MKKVTMLLTRHGKNLPELGKTLSAEEIDRAQDAGGNIYDQGHVSIGTVFYSPLPRAIQTAFAVIMGHNSGLPCLMPAVLAFGTEELFAKLTAPSQFRPLASVKGNYMALFDVHDMDVLKPWFDELVVAVEQVFVEAEDGSTALIVAHSPSIEAALNAILKRQGSNLSVEYLTLNELDTVVVTASQEAEESPMIIEVIGKIAAPAIEEVEKI